MANSILILKKYQIMYFQSNQSYRTTYLMNSSLLGQNITPELILNQHLTELKKASMENRKCCGKNFKILSFVLNFFVNIYLNLR